MKRWHPFLTAGVLLATGVGASGYALIGSKWNVSPVTMHLNLGAAGALIDGSTTWDQVAAGALGTWNYYLLGLQFTSVVDSTVPHDDDGVNNVFFSSTIFGENFGAGVLAVTTEWDVPGSHREVRSEADVIFNSALSWNSYRGPLRRSGGQTVYDLRRVALHEFGHVVGLDHPDEAGQNVTAIMNSTVSDLDSLQVDDIEGGQFLYGAQPDTEARELATLERPKKDLATKSLTYLFRGSADATRAVAVFLTNSRLGKKKFFKAQGVSLWKRSLTLRPGRNVVTLYVRTPDGMRKKVATRIVNRTSGD